MSAETLDQIGLAAQFVAFWFVTPEIVTANTLNRAATMVLHGFAWIDGQIGGFIRRIRLWALIFGLTGGVRALVWGEADSIREFLLWSLLGLLGVLLVFLLLFVAKGSFWIMVRFLRATEGWRKRFAVAGAALFVGGIAAQFAATL